MTVPPAIARRLFRLSVGIFFMGGFVSSTISLVVPRLRLFLGLDYSRAATVQLANYSSYLLFALPITVVIITIGYMRGNAVGLGLMAIGCVMLAAGLSAVSFPLMLAALLITSAGASFLQIGSNNLAALVGEPSTAARRLNLLQGFNSIGTVLGPLIGAQFLLGDGRPTMAVPNLIWPFIFAAIVLGALAVAFTANRDMLRDFAPAGTQTSRADWARLLANRRLLAGAGAIFCYVGAEVAIGSFLPDYLMRKDGWALAPVSAAQLVSLYWGGAMVGRLGGAALLGHTSGARLLSLAAAAALLLTATAAAVGGTAGAIALLAVGFCNSIMYPTIYVLALPRDPAAATPAAMVLCMAVVGGAAITWGTGLTADRVGLGPAMTLPAICYLAVLVFARRCARTDRNL